MRKSAICIRDILPGASGPYATFLAFQPGPLMSPSYIIGSSVTPGGNNPAMGPSVSVYLPICVTLVGYESGAAGNNGIFVGNAVSIPTRFRTYATFILSA